MNRLRNAPFQEIDPVYAFASANTGNRTSWGLGQSICFSANGAAFLGLRAFSEPLVADSRAASEEENAAFLKAMNMFLFEGQAESLEGFLRDWPESRWAARLNTTLGS